MNDKDKEAYENLWDEEIIQKLQAENAKLRECVEFYADLDEEAIGYDIRGVTYARQVLKELDNNQLNDTK